MHPLRYKQQRQLINALRRTFGSPRQLLALLTVLGYAGLSMGMILAVLVLPLPTELQAFMDWMGMTADMREQLQSLRGLLTITLLMIASTAAFQNPLLRFAPADIDILFTTPVPIWRVMLGRALLNHMRALLAGYFFWGLVLVPILRLSGYQPWPLAVWGLLGLMLLFSSIDQLFASIQTGLANSDTQPTSAADQVPEKPATTLWLVRAALLLLGLLSLLLLLGLLGRLLSGTWALLDVFLQAAGGSLVGTLLLPLGLATELLLLPTEAASSVAPALGGLLLLDIATGLLLLRQVQRGGAGILLETSLAPGAQPSQLDELLVRSGFNPLRFAAALWYGTWHQAESQAARSPALPCFGQRARTHLWRRLTELRRTPLRNILAALLLGLVPLAFYDPTEGYSLTRLLTAIVLSSSLGTQLFNDAADHLRYANLELSAPVSRWRILLYAHVPRLLLYWMGGLLLLLGVGLLAPAARWDELAILALWYPLMLIPLLALRGALVFIYPAAGLPGQRDPVQTMLVALINGLLVLIVIMLSTLPFGVLLTLMSTFSIGALFFWPVVFLSSGIICTACCALLVWTYQRYEPGE
jgi:hypothetical protein